MEKSTTEDTFFTIIDAHNPSSGDILDINKDDILYTTRKIHLRNEKEESPETVLIFFITGNPGLIGYYIPFLEGLVARLEGDFESDEDGHGVLSVNGKGSGSGGSNDNNIQMLQNQSSKKRDRGGGRGHADVTSSIHSVVSGTGTGTNKVNKPKKTAATTTSAKTKHRRYVLYGTSLAGYEVASNQQSQDERERIYSLREQIDLALRKIDLVVERISGGGDDGQPYPSGESMMGGATDRKGGYGDVKQHNIKNNDDMGKRSRVKVVLVGHSVGAYIALEVVRLWHERGEKTKMEELSGDMFRQSSHGSQDETGVDTCLSQPSFEDTPDQQLLSELSAYVNTTSKSITANIDYIPDMSTTTSQTLSPPIWYPHTCILLTPTIINISHSSSGRITTPLLNYLPFLPRLAQSAVQFLTWLLPPNALEKVVQLVTNMSAGHGLDTTVKFLKSSRGVRQALEMTVEEMNSIREDQWGEEVWGVVREQSLDGDFDSGESQRSSRTRSPRLYFWFAKKDHWVADVTRDEIVKARSSCRETLADGERAKIVIEVDDTGGLEHAWCIRQSQTVAERVAIWIEDCLA